MAFSMKIGLMAGFIIGVLCIEHHSTYYVLYGAIFIFAVYSMYEKFIEDFLEKYCLLFVPPKTAPRQEHDKKRSLTYPNVLTNTWYQLADSSEVPKGKVLEVRALDRVFAIWRTDEGKVVVQDAFCLHLGANLAVNGKVEDNCLMCPFHKWKFAEDGSIKEIPYLDEPHKCPSHKKLKTYVSQEYCNMIMVYFHADDAEPEFQLPAFIPAELKRDGYQPHLNWEIGFVTLSPVDWVDQASDHAHFNQLHGDFIFPWTTVPIPSWLFKLFPLSITHQLHTYLGDEDDWARQVQQTGWGQVCKQMIYFTDFVGLTWGGKKIENSMSQTIETFIGPAVMCFHIPFTIGTIKVFVTTTPVEGGSVMRVRTWVDGKTARSWLIRGIAWVLTGISASQLRADVDILCNKIRLRKPLLQPGDGPYSRTNQWLKQFYSAGSDRIGQHAGCGSYKNDW